MSGVGRQEGTGKPPSMRASQVGEVLEDSEQGDNIPAGSGAWERQCPWYGRVSEGLSETRNLS